MNRWDKIKAAALDVADHVTQDPARREAMAGDLITLVGLMINAVGKGVAVNGEADMNDARTADFPWDDGSFDPTPELVAEAAAERATDEAIAYTRYLTGEALQTQADLVASEARNADLSRYATPVWRPRCADSDCGLRDGHTPVCEADQSEYEGHHPGCPGCSRGAYDGHADHCNELCPECNRIMRFGHMFCKLDPSRPNGEGVLDLVRRCPDCNESHDCRCTETSDDVCCDTPYGPDCKSAPVQRCAECNRAEGDGHARGCKWTGCVAVHLSHDLDCGEF